MVGSLILCVISSIYSISDSQEVQSRSWTA